jgi:hypothetical protein
LRGSGRGGGGGSEGAWCGLGFGFRVTCVSPPKLGFFFGVLR